MSNAAKLAGAGAPASFLVSRSRGLEVSKRLHNVEI